MRQVETAVIIKALIAFKGQRALAIAGHIIGVDFPASRDVLVVFLTIKDGDIDGEAPALLRVESAGCGHADDLVDVLGSLKLDFAFAHMCG